MKQFKITILLTMLMSMTGTKAYAYDYDLAVENADGKIIYYNYINDGKELEVTRGGYGGNIVIPDEVNYKNRTRKVTRIGKEAFSNLPLDSVTIGNNVTSIGERAFWDCTILTSVTIGNSVTSIGNGAFENCTLLTSVNISDLEAWFHIKFGVISNPLSWAQHLYLNGEEIKDLVVPNSVTSIGDRAFQAYYGLTSVTIPNSVTSIGEEAFSDCRSLTSLTIPNSVTSIGIEAFSLCKSLTSVTIPNSVTSIAHGAFSLCKSLTSVTIPNSVTSIGSHAFIDCYGLTSVTIGNNLTSIGDWAFYGCTGLTSITIPNSVTSIGEEAFGCCYGLTSVTIGNSVESIDKYAFYQCRGLTSVTIPNSVTSIGNYAFRDCSGLTSVTIGNGVTSIGDCAFYNPNITTIYSLIENPFSIYSSSFSKDTYFNATLYVPVGTIDKYKSMEGWKDFVFIEEWTGDNNEEPSENPDNPDDVSTTTGKCGETVNYSYDKATHTLAISGEGETYDYDDGSNKAPWSAYADEIQKIEIESGIISVGYFAFYKCSSLTSLSFPATLKYIGLSAFEDCTSLSSLSLNEGLLIIEGSAFKNCKGITDVYCYAESVPKTNKAAFDGTPIESATLYVPANSVKAYKASRPWSDFKNIVAIGSTPVDDPTSGSCGETANYSYDKDTHTLTISGEGEIYDYDDGSNKAPWSAYADEIQKIEIEPGIISVGYFAFYKCSSLTSLSVPATLKYIGLSAFEDCTSLSSLSLNEGLLIIEGSAFKNCNSITEVYCYAKSVPKANKTAFDRTPIESATLYVPANSVEAYKASRPWSGFKEIVPLNGNPDGIIGNKQSDDVKTVYSIKGEKLLHPTKGVNIIKMKDGTIKKVFVK